MKKTIVAIALLATSLRAAPLFPDVPDNHWAKDAVAALAAKGLVEGYPDGTFKGDRAASRYEVAMIVARLLAKMEQEHATFATKAELQELRKLVDALREELEALGVRVQNLEENVGRLDKRVTELERVTFYGNVKVRAGAQSFHSYGSNQSDPVAPAVNYTTAVGTVVGAGDTVPGTTANYDPFTFGVLPVVNWGKGTPLTNGPTFTSDARLGMNVHIADGLDGQIEFAAYSAQGNELVDTYYGTSASYLLNPFTAISTVTGGQAGNQPLNHRPFTRMVLDHIWLRHDPSRTELTLGSFLQTNFDNSIYIGMINPNAWGPANLGSYGAQVQGQFTLDGETDENGNENRYTWGDYEVMGTLLPDRNGGVGGASYFNHAEGANLGLHFHDDRGKVRLNFLHAGQDASGGAAEQVGLITTVNTNSLTPWVNPSGFYVNQLPGVAATAGIGSTTDLRPVPMPLVGVDVFSGLTAFPNVGNVGPQSETLFGVSARYEFDNENKPFVLADFSHSDYRPNKNSTFRTGGNAWRVGAGASVLDGDLDLDAEYVRTDENYDPFVLQIPRVGGIGLNHWRPFDLNQYGNLYSLHDTEAYPNNREGFRFSGDWTFARADEAHDQIPVGELFLKYQNLRQVATSQQDIRFSTNSIAPGTPTSTVFGFSPGFVDPAFGGFSILTYVPSGGNLIGAALENPRGRTEGIHAGVAYKFLLEEDSKRGVRPALAYRSQNFFRNSNLAALRPGPAGIFGENVNYQDFTYQLYHGDVSYDVTDKVLLNLAYDEFHLFGHWDPYGTYGPFAVASGQTRFRNLDTIMRSPVLSLDWEVTDVTSVGLQARYFSTSDQIAAGVFPTPTNPSTNFVLPAQATAHPFNWDGYQLSTVFNYRF